MQGRKEIISILNRRKGTHTPLLKRHRLELLMDVTEVPTLSRNLK